MKRRHAVQPPKPMNIKTRTCTSVIRLLLPGSKLDILNHFMSPELANLILLKWDY